MASLDGVTRLSIPGESIAYGAANHLVRTADFSSATWNTAATHTVFGVTGQVRARILAPICTANLTDAADGAMIQYGLVGDTDYLILVTNAAGKGGETITAGTIWRDQSPGDLWDVLPNCLFDLVIGNGQDIGYEITGAALTGGTLVFNCWWEPLTVGSVVTLGAGGALS
jgi:hypothetical protein